MKLAKCCFGIDVGSQRVAHRPEAEGEFKRGSKIAIYNKLVSA